MTTLRRKRKPAGRSEAAGGGDVKDLPAPSVSIGCGHGRLPGPGPINDLESKRLMLEVAVTYDNLAKKAEERGAK